jgi:acetylornithine deacetylase/succinyl-diaminopimelate desuccinylase-like protein
MPASAAVTGTRRAQKRHDARYTPAMSDHLSRVLAAAEAGFGASVQRLSDFLRIPSISTDPAYDGDTRHAGQWLVDELRRVGFNADLVDTIGHPMVVAHHDGPKGYQGPRALYYGHYDVQPADPLELWESPPFEPVIKPSPYGQKIVARGAVDDKGQVMCMVEAFRAWHEAAGGPPIPVTIMFEGEEESGSKSLEPFMQKHKADLAADVCLVSDTGLWDHDTPAITTMLRGLVYIEAVLKGSSHDLHSGMFGGAVRNPCNELVEILAQLHDRDGRVMIKGFYDEVEEPSAEVKKQWGALEFDEIEFVGGAGLKTPFGEKGRTTLERTWSRPTCDINGLYGGYTGKGAKTVIGSTAGAKISCRLVAKQDPKKIEAALVQFLKDRTPPDFSWHFETHGSSPAIKVSTDSPYLAAARKGLKDVYGKESVLIGSGGSIPAVGAVQRILGMESLLVGFGLDDDRVHSPNEKFELSCYQRGILTHARIMHELALLRV